MSTHRHTHTRAYMFIHSFIQYIVFSPTQYFFRFFFSCNLFAFGVSFVVIVHLIWLFFTGSMSWVRIWVLNEWNRIVCVCVLCDAISFKYAFDTIFLFFNPPQCFTFDCCFSLWHWPHFFPISHYPCSVLRALISNDQHWYHFGNRWINSKA